MRSLPAPRDREQVRRAREGDLRAFDDLAARHAGRAYRAALAVLGDHHDAQDTAQDAFLAAWQALGGFRGDSEFGTWLHTVVNRLALNKAARRRQAAILDQDSLAAGTAAGPSETVEAAAAARSLGAAVRALPAAQRSAVTLHYLGGLPYDQVAALTGTTVPSVRGHLYRGRRMLAAPSSGGAEQRPGHQGDPPGQGRRTSTCYWPLFTSGRCRCHVLIFLLNTA